MRLDFSKEKALFFYKLLHLHILHCLYMLIFLKNMPDFSKNICYFFTQISLYKNMIIKYTLFLYKK